MTKKKRSHPGVDEILQRPWCYYCERDFDDLKILINHQKAKHFKCERCGRRLSTAGGLSVHMSQVHKENLTAVDNALPNRAGLEIEIFGMEGIPEEIVQQHHQRVLTQYHQAEAERKAASGNAVPGAGEPQAKKPKTETMSDLKKRLAEHKAAKLAAENGGSSGSATPTGAGQSQTQQQQPSPSPAPHIGAFQAGQLGQPGYQQYPPQAYAPPPSTTSYSQPVSYSPAQPNFAQPPYGHSPGQPPFSQQSPYGAPSPFPPQPSFSPPPPFQQQPAYPSAQYPPQMPPNVPYPGQPSAMPHRMFGATSPQPPFQPPQPTHSPAQNGVPQRPPSGGLPVAPGLPQRPAVSAPPVNAFQFQQMHQGQIPAPGSHIQPPSSTGPPGVEANGIIPRPPGQLQQLQQETPNADSIDDLISNASKQADANAAAAAAAQNTIPQLPPPTTAPSSEHAKNSTPISAAPAPAASTEEKTSKKDKDKDKEKSKQTRLVYSDNEISPEEKMAMMPKYAFTRQETVAV